MATEPAVFSGREQNVDNMRVERDTMGEMWLPKDALYGASTQRAVENFPISVRLVTIFADGLGKDLSSAAQSTASAFFLSNTLVSAILTVSNPGSAMILDKLFCDFMYLSLVGAQNTTYTTAIFRLIKKGIEMDFIPRLSFERVMIYERCEVSDTLSDNGIDCSFMVNERIGMYLLAVLICTNSCVRLCNKLFRKKLVMHRRALKSKLLRGTILSVVTVFDAFDTRYFVLKMDGNILEILMFSLLHLIKMANDRAMWIGLPPSVIFVLYYVFFVLFLAKTASQLTAKCCSANPTVRFASIKHAIRDVSKTGYINIFYDGYKFPFASKLSIYHPLIVSLRYVLLAIILSSMTSTGIVMTVCTSIIELVFYCYVLTSPVKDSCIENWVDQFNAGVHAAFNILGCITFLHTSPALSLAIDFSMIFLLLALTFVNVSLVVFELLVVVYKVLIYTSRSSKAKGQTPPMNRVKPVLDKKLKAQRLDRLSVLKAVLSKKKIIAKPKV